MISTCPTNHERLTQAAKHLDAVAKIPFVPLLTIQKNFQKYQDRDIVMLGGWDGFYNLILAKGNGRRFYRVDMTLWEIESQASDTHPQGTEIGRSVSTFNNALALEQQGKLTLLAAMPDVAQLLDAICLPDAIDLYGVEINRSNQRNDRVSLFGDYLPPYNLLTQIAAAKIAGAEVFSYSDLPSVISKSAVRLGAKIESCERTIERSSMIGLFGSCVASLCVTPRPTIDYNAINSIIHGVPAIVAKASVLASRITDFDYLCVVDTHAAPAEIALKLIQVMRGDREEAAQLSHVAMEHAAKENNSRIIQALSFL